MSGDKTTTTQQSDERTADSAGYSLLFLLAEIREAVGDPKGRLMQEDLVTHIRSIVSAGEEMKRILEIPGASDFKEWATDNEIDEAVKHWDTLLSYNDKEANT